MSTSLWEKVLAARSASSFPSMPTWLGTQQNHIFILLTEVKHTLFWSSFTTGFVVLETEVRALKALKESVYNSIWRISLHNAIYSEQQPM